MKCNLMLFTHTCFFVAMPTLTCEALKKDKTYLKLIKKQQKELEATKKKHSKVSQE